MLNWLYLLALSVLSVYADADICEKEDYLMVAISGTSLCLPAAALDKCPSPD